MMSRMEHEERALRVRGVLARWCLVLLAVGAFAAWASWRMTTAAEELAGAAPATGVEAPAERILEHWTCSMHPEVRLPEPGECPVCGMPLVPQYSEEGEPQETPDAPRAWYLCTMPECNDPGSDDPESRCPVCGMQREPVMLDPKGGEPGEARLSLSEHARRLAGLAAEPVAYRHLSRSIRTVGKVTYDETRRRMVSAWTSGRIDRLFADFTGMVVSQGDHLVEIYSPELVSAQEEMLQFLRGLRAMSADSPGPARESAQALIDSARQKLELLGITPAQIEALEETGRATTHLVMHAPLGGTIVRKWAMEGMYAKTGDPLYEIADLTRVWLLLDLYEADLPWIAPFQAVELTARSLPGEKFQGEIAFVDPLVDDSTRTIKVRVGVDNPERRLKPGMFVTARIGVSLGEGGRAAAAAARGDWACPMHTWETAEALAPCPICEMDMVLASSIPGHRPPLAAAPVLSVPREAVLRTGERSLVYVEEEPGVYAGLEVALGPVAQDEGGRPFYPVLGGLQEGQRVVTRGNFAIDSQMQIAGRPSLFNAPEPGAAPQPAPSHDHPMPEAGRDD